MTTRRPVEVIIACHSAERPLARAVASVLDGSGDVASVTVVSHNLPASDLERLVPPRHRTQVRWLALADGGNSPAGPFNLGLKGASSPWVSIMGSDDMLEPGAVQAWLSLARGVDAVITRVHYPDGSPMRTPPVRPLWHRRRDAVKDRLYYRSAPLGLVRTGFMREAGLELTTGLPTGEDLAFSTALWSRGRTAVQEAGPGYRVGEDATDRVTFSPRQLSSDLAHIGHVWNHQFLGALSSSQITALGTKYLRIHLFGAAFYRAQSAWGPGDREALAQAATTILSLAPLSAEPLSLADRQLLDGILDLAVPDHAVNELAFARRRFGSWKTLVTRDPRYLLHREAPLRFMAASALVR